MSLTQLFMFRFFSFTGWILLMVPWGVSDVRGRELRSISPGGPCSAQFQNCVTSYFGLFVSFQRNYTNGSPILVDRDSVDSLCRDSGTFQECLANLQGVCHSDIYWGSQRVHYYFDLANYTCSVKGMKALLKMAGSRCDPTVNSDRMRSKCEMDTQRTYQMEKEISDRPKQQLHCSFVQQRRQCTVTAITQACSAAVADFLMGIDQHVNAERYEYERKLHGC
ncbi:hypothetical protein BsWGS_21264 [Bradybaena similaris]